jgi:hypothetical protein
MDEKTLPMTVKRQAASEVVPYSYKMHFGGMNYRALISDDAKLQRFTTNVRERVSLAVDLAVGNIQVGMRRLGWGGEARVSSRMLPWKVAVWAHHSTP